MAQDRPVTPEKQLLRLIEDSKGINTAGNTHAIVHHGLSLFSLDAWKGRVSFLKSKFQKLFKANDALFPDIKAINGVLMVAVFIMTVYFASSVLIWIINMNKAHNLGGEVKVDVVKNEEIAEATMIKKPMSYYLEKIGVRDIFKMGVKKVAAAAPETKKETKAASPAIVEAIQNLKLVGISWSKDPDAIIEDTKVMKTYFLKRGGSIAGLKVQAMFKDKVILSFGGEEIELR